MADDLSSEFASAVDLRRTDCHPDFWYPIAWSEDLAPGKMLARTYAGEPVAVVRSKDGALFALENRCAHRQVPLTPWSGAGLTVKCGYHGWAYDAASGGAWTCPIWARNACPMG